MVSCYLCSSSDVKFEGYFVADKDDDSVDWLMGKRPKGKKRVFVVYLCEECFSLPNKKELILKEIEGNVKLKNGYAMKIER
ncbi:hypothetical protein ES705_20678 [subsurface metagenome]